MFGDGNFGVLGLGNENSVSYKNPVKISFFSKNNIRIKDVALGERHSIFLSENGDVYTCGYGGDKGIFSFFRAKETGALGHGNKNHLGLPKKIDYFANSGIKIKQISAGRFHSLALDTNGDVYAWGKGAYGSLGTGELKPHASPVVLSVLRDSRKENPDNEIVKIDSADSYSVAITKRGDLLTWGENNHGQMGIGSGTGFDLIESENLPIEVSFKDDVSIADFYCGERTMISFDTKGNIYKTGMKLDYTPKLMKIPSDFELTKISKVFCGERHYTILYGISHFNPR